MCQIRVIYELGYFGLVTDHGIELKSHMCMIG